MKNSKWVAIVGVVAVMVSMGQAWGMTMSMGPSYCDGSKTTAGDVCKEAIGSSGVACILGNYWEENSGGIYTAQNSCSSFGSKGEVYVYSCDGNKLSFGVFFCNQGDDCMNGKCWHSVKTANGGSSSSYVPTLTTDPSSAAGVNGAILGSSGSSEASGALGASSWSSVGHTNNSKIPGDSKPTSGASDQAQSGGCSLIR